MMCNSCPTGVVEHVMAAATTRQRHVCQSIVSSHKPVSGDHGGRRPRGIITLLDALILPFFQHFQLQHLLRLCSHRRTVSVSRLQHSCRRRRHRPTAVSQLWLFGGRKEERIQVRRPPGRPPFSLSRPACCARSSSLSSLHLGWRLSAPAPAESPTSRLRPAVPSFWSREGKKTPYRSMCG